MPSKTPLYRTYRNELIKFGLNWISMSPNHWPTIIISKEVMHGNDKAKEFMELMRDEAVQLFNIELTDLEIADIYLDILKIIDTDINHVKLGGQ